MGARAARVRAHRGRDRVVRRHRAAARRRLRGGGVDAAALHGEGRLARPGRPCLHLRGRRAGPRVLPRLHDDRPRRRRRRRTASIGRSTSTAPTSRTPSSTPTAAARRSPTRPSSARARRVSRRSPLALPRTPATCSPGGCRSARSSTRDPATRAATPTSACGSPTTAPTRTTYDARVEWLFKMMSPRKVRELRARGGRPRRRRLAAAAPRCGQHRHPRPARRGRRGVDPLRPAGQGRSASGCARAPSRSTRRCYDHRAAGREERACGVARGGRQLRDRGTRS